MFNRIFALGASGGRGLHNQTGGRGSLVRAAFWFQEGDTIFISVGQPGANACSEKTESFEGCKGHSVNLTDTPAKGFVKSRSEVGGGGGGGTYVFKMNPHQKMKYLPLLIAGGGGGGSGKLNADKKYKKRKFILNLLMLCVLLLANVFCTHAEMHGRGFDYYNVGTAGNGDGSGGGWRKETTGNQTGQSLLSGAHGGLPCKRLAKW